MKKLILIAVLTAAVAGPLPGHAGLDGCIAANAPVDGPVHYTNTPSCSYRAVKAGNIVAVGAFTVKVWWNGVCDSGAPDWVRSSSSGDDNGPVGRGGSWEGSIAAGSCATATAEFPGSVVAIGQVSP